MSSISAEDAFYAIGTIIGFVVAFFIGCHCGERTSRSDVECLAEDAAAFLAKTSSPRESWFVASVLAAYIRATRLLGSKRGDEILHGFVDRASAATANLDVAGADRARTQAGDLETALANIMKAEHCDDEP